jgi:hypothetical protein
MALDLCDAAGARADATPVVSELRQRHVTFEEPRIFQSQPQLQSMAQPTLVTGPSMGQPFANPMGPPYTQPSAQMPSAHEDLCVQKGTAGSTLKAIAVVVGVLLVAGAVWLLKQRLVARFLARKTKHGEGEGTRLEPPLPARRTWRQQLEPQKPPVPPKRVSFSAQGAEKQPRPPRPQSAKVRRPASDAQEESRRQALLAAHNSVRAREEEEVEESGDEDYEAADPNFTEI